MEWFLNEPEELARLPHYIVPDDNITSGMERRGVKGRVFPAVPSGERNFLLVSPSTDEAHLVAINSLRRVRLRENGVVNDYTTWLVSRRVVVKVC